MHGNYHLFASSKPNNDQEENLQRNHGIHNDSELSKKERISINDPENVKCGYKFENHSIEHLHEINRKFLEAESNKIGGRPSKLPHNYNNLMVSRRNSRNNRLIKRRFKGGLANRQIHMRYKKIASTTEKGKL